MNMFGDTITGTKRRALHQISLTNQPLTIYPDCAGGLWAVAVRSPWLCFTLLVPITRGFPMKAGVPHTFVFAWGFSAQAQATCTDPASPAAPPDGKTAT